MGLTSSSLKRCWYNTNHGFAGTVDIVGQGSEGARVHLDWKTRKTQERMKVTAYDFQIHQIAAYAATYWGEEAVLGHSVHGANCLHQFD